MSASIREAYEARERSFIAPFGRLSAETRGRIVEEEPCPVRTAFQLDRDRIVYSNAFRRLKHKTQVFLSPLGDDYRTRLTHTLEVAQIARNIARSFLLNEDLTEAIALGHDLGHTPFGHSGETVLKEIYSPEFSHALQSLRVVEVLENEGQGLNLTHEVREGIERHSKGFGKILPDPSDDEISTKEAQVVRIADLMAYLNHDLDDAIRSGVIRREQVPEVCVKTIGRTHSERASRMIKDLISSSRVEGELLDLRLSRKMLGAMYKLRKFLYNNVYRSSQVHGEFEKAKKILSELFAYFLDHPDKLAKRLAELQMRNGNMDGQPRERVVCDLIASMTDRYAMNLYSKLFFPTPLQQLVN
jgi:dGTPase